MADAEAHHAGEDSAQVAAFEFPGPSPWSQLRARCRLSE
jgi:hypothetical protein